MSHDALDERHDLAKTLRETDPDAPTLCGDWTAALLTAHMLQRERSVTEMLGRLPVQRFRDRAEVRLSDVVAQLPYLDLVAKFEAGPPRISPWAAPPIREAVNLLEYAIHHEDVRRATADTAPRALPAARQTAIWRRARVSAPLTLRALPIGVRLIAPGFGEAATRRARSSARVVTVTGAPLELLLVASGRQRVARVEYDGAPADIALLTDAAIPL